MELKIRGREINYKAPVYVIAEGCDNHMGSLGTAKKMALLAKLSGSDAIKFQHHLPDEEMLPNVPMSDNFDIPLYEFLKINSLSLEDHVKLKEYCELIDITYLCTPFSLKAAQELNEIGIEAFKIGSGEMTDIPTLEEIAKMGKPMIVSTGMCTFEEIDRTYNALVKYEIPLAFTNCVSEYPPIYEDINLGVIPKMISRYPQAVIGHSDHTPDLYTCYGAVALGAAIIEKHVIIEKNIPGPDQSVSIDFFDLKNLTDGVRKVKLAGNSEKIVHSKEQAIREWAFRSIVSLCDISKDEIITQEMIWSKRPGTGIPSYKMGEIIGKKVTRDISKNSLIFPDDIE